MNAGDVRDKPAGGLGYGTTVILLGIVLAVLGLTLRAWVPVVMAVPLVVVGAVTVARRGESREARLQRNEGYQRSTLGLVLAVAVAVAFWAWAILGRAPLMFVFAPLWTVTAGMRIWRATHGGEPLVRRDRIS